MKAFLQTVMVSAAVGCVAVALATAPEATRVAAGSSAKARGAELFKTNGCVHCHSIGGFGGRQGPDLQMVWKRLSKTQISDQIHNGGKSMPEYGDRLSPVEIDDLVAFLHAKRKPLAVTAAPPDEAKPADSADPE